MNGISLRSRFYLLPILVMITCAFPFLLKAEASKQHDATVTLTASNITLAAVFKAIYQQTRMAVLYNNSMLNDREKVNVDFRDTKLDEVLRLLLDKRGFNWIYNGTYISISPKKKEAQDSRHTSLRGDTSATAQSIEGKVTDAAGGPLIGATVQVKGTAQGTTTDADGKFALAKAGPNDVLIISSVGFETREVPVKGRNIMARLNVVVNDLDETVVIAYGTTTKRFNTGNVASVKSEDIGKQPVSNPLQALQGRVPGMLITQQTGVSGGSFNVQIRGRNSIANGNDPLYVIDGVPYTSILLPGLGFDIFGGSNVGTAGNPLNYINVANIESIDILKDADATAIYGSRGANGVVLITTKQGKEGKMMVDVNVNSGIGKVTSSLQLLDTKQYLQMRREAFLNDNRTPTTSNAADLLVWDSTRYTDWQKEIFGGTAKFTNAQLSVSGGNALTQYNIGGSYSRQTTVFPGDFEDRKVGVNFNIASRSLNQRFNILFSGSYMLDNNRLPAADMSPYIDLAPNAPAIHNPDGTLNFENSTFSNPFGILNQRFKQKANNLISNATLAYKLLPGLVLKTSLGYTNLQIREVKSTPITAFNPALIGSLLRSSSFTNNRISSWIAEPQLTYETTLWKGKLEALVGATLQTSNNEGEILTGTGYTSDALLNSIKAAPNVRVENASAVQYKYSALFGRLNYNLAGKYLFNLTARRDGSSRFGPANQFHNFAALGLGWIFSEEKFLRNENPILSFGKIRASYGSAGNDQIGDYRFLNLYDTYGLPYQGVPGLVLGNLYNPDLQWEVNKKLEVGLELGFVKDRILFNVSWYLNRSSNQLISYPLSTVTGFGEIPYNFDAVVQNRGLELSLSTRNIQTSSLSWNTTFNISFEKNKLASFPELNNSPYADLLIIGQPISIGKVLAFAGVNAVSGVYEFYDSKGSRTSTPNPLTDRTSIVNVNPKYYGGMSNTIRYGSFDLDFSFQFVKQDGYYDPFTFMPGLNGRNQQTVVLSRWQKEGDLSNIQRFSRTVGSPTYNAFLDAKASDNRIVDASFIRMRNLSLSYRFPEEFKRKLHLQNGRVYIQGQNLFTITGYKGMDPENQSTNNIPPLFILTAGIQFTL